MTRNYLYNKTSSTKFFDYLKHIPDWPKLIHFTYVLNQMLKSVNVNGKKVIDIGCGNGHLAVYLAMVRNAKVAIGIDSYKGIGYDANSKYIFKKAIDDLNLSNVIITQGDIRKMPFADNMFDCATLSFVMHHVIREKQRLEKSPDLLYKTSKIFREICRILKPGGVLVICEVRKTSIFRILPSDGYISWETKQDPNGWIDALKLSGFKRLYYKNYFSRRLSMFPFGKKFFTSDIFNILYSVKYFIYAIK